MIFLNPSHRTARTWSRRITLLTSFWVALLSCRHVVSAGTKRNEKSVLFVCQFGSVKSAIAREVFRRAAADAGLSVIGFSRGITPEEHLSTDLAAKLAADAIDPRAQTLQALRQEDIAAADLVVFFDPIPAPFDLKSGMKLDWSDSPSFNNDYSRARSILDQRIATLVASLKASSSDP